MLASPTDRPKPGKPGRTVKRCLTRPNTGGFPMETVTIGGATILLDAVDTDRDGRTVYGYSIRLDGVNPTYQSRDLKSGCGGGTEREGMESLLSFLTAAAESYRYWKGMKEDSNTDLFPEEICEWAYMNEDEIGFVAYEYAHPDEQA